MTLNVFRFTGLNSSLALKAPARCATTANITLLGLQTIDGVLLQSSDSNLRVLVKNQTDSRQNGIYDAQSGNWTRSTDWDSNDDFVKGTRVGVANGATQIGDWVLTTVDPITLGTSNITFASESTFDFPDGTAAAPGIAFAAEQATGLYRPASGQIGVALSGSAYALFAATGLTLGVAGTLLGALLLAGNTSGTTTIKPQAMATGTLLLPAVSATDTVAVLGLTGQTFTGGIWNASTIAGQYGGTGVANTGFTFTLAGTSAIPILTNPSAAVLQLGAADAAAPIAQTLSVQSVVAGTSNTVGQDLTFNASRGTGTGAGGRFIWQVAAAGGAGNSQNALTQAMILDTTNKLTINPGGNGTITAGNNLLLDATSGGNVTIGSAGTTTEARLLAVTVRLGDQFANNPTFLTRPAAATLQFGAADAASPVAQTLQVQSVVAGTSNTAGVTFTIGGSKSTGNAAGGAIQIAVALAGGAGSTQNALTNIWNIAGTGHTLWNTDNTYDIGASGATRPRNLYVGSSGAFGGNPAASNPGRLTVSLNATATPSNPALAPVIHGIGVDGSSAEITFDAFGTGVSPDFIGRRSRGTLASQSGVLADDRLFFVGGVGWTSAGAFSNNVAAIWSAANETFSGTNQGTYLSFAATPNGSVTRAEVMRVWGSGGVSIQGASPTDPGAGNLRVTGTAEMATLRIDQAPTAVTSAGATISSAADGANNLGHRVSVNLNGSTYWIPCSSVAF